MSDGELFLFDLDKPESQPLVDMPISPEQVHEIMQAFEVAGITDSETKKRIVHSCIIRAISHPRELLAKDVRPILKRIREFGKSEPTSGSAWDNRTEETWIDKL
ncbi:hypothetical protein CXX84_03895 [Arthrobacter sp. AFG7.2]|uniref:hypothetical protein n=1 Tax=Arthrobacter sp. AFG7.2 TaxID=1688693 RepID=UPI000C9EB5EA|nr:hypothetical protein [Arthrobacter sp. AFG7.2]PNI09417.1 hypothetical protein CXX84_03895 [Arthrobacter sp. AFG7.2]